MNTKINRLRRAKSNFSDHQGGFDDAVSLVQKNTGPQYQDITQDDKDGQPYWKMNFMARVTSMERTKNLSASGSSILPTSLS